jgi:PTS system mannose-specific IIC component
MALNMFQIILISAWAFWGIIDALSYGIGFNNCIIACLFTGIVVGNPSYGLVVGGTLQMTQLGAGTYGGASIPNITSSGMITTALGAGTVAAGASISEISTSAVTMAASVGIALASLFTQLDILARFCNTFFQHRADGCLEKGDEKGIQLNNVLGIIPWGLSRALPVFFLLAFGQGLVDSILQVIPTWLLDGFKIAGGMLPVVGFAILLRYLPVKKTPQYLILGFVLSAYVGQLSPLTSAVLKDSALTTAAGSVGFTILGISLLGLVLAISTYQKSVKESQATKTGGNDIDD